VKDKFQNIKDYYKKIGDNIDIPIILQNAPPPLGSAMSVSNIANIVEEIPLVNYVKEENMPCGQRISQLSEIISTELIGVFGGAGGRFMMDELNRGAIGVMPACELTEIHVKIYQLFDSGKYDEARTVFNRLLPLLNFQSVFRMAMTKEILVLRDIVSCSKVRVGGIILDTQDKMELKILLDSIQDLLIT
jgi:4-hydroxy-tetrahydrodipicolinate synthase